MRRILVALVVVSSCLGSVAWSTPFGALDHSTDRARYRPGQEVIVTLSNLGDTTWSIEGDWKIQRVHNGDNVARYVLSEAEKTLEPGEQISWHWDQHMGCYGGCQNVWEGDPAGPGNYVAVVGKSEIGPRFEIGEFFTLGFRELPDKFVVFVRKQEAIDQMTAEAQAEEKTLIVSGIVRDGAKYNPNWSYKMGPGTIVLGEVFIEVCDASPHYVEENRDQWLGQRWCPWSSYVEKVGK